MKKFTINSSLKTILFSIFTASVIFAAASCEIGLGEAVDIEAPVVTVTSPEPTSAVPKEFTVEGSVSDNMGVKELTVTVSETGQKFKWNGGWTTLVNNNWEKYNNAAFSGNSENLKWSVTFSVTGASSGETYTLLTTATDEAGNEGKQSKDERSFTVDVNEPVVSIVAPLLESTYDSTRYGDNYKDGAILKNLINRDFSISGIQKEDTRLSKLYVLLDESSSSSVKSYNEASDISTLPHIYLKELDGSRSWTCDVKEADLVNNWEEADRNKKHFIRLVTESHDAAGNIERRVQGWFTYWNESDIPWSNVAFGDDHYIPYSEDENAPKQSVVYPSCTLQGESYDDDGLKAVDIEVWLSQDAETEPTIRRSDLDKHYDLTDKDYPTFYSWSLTAISEKKNFKVSITATDKNGIKSQTITKYLGIANVNPPSITINTPTALLGDANGNFTISGTIKDDGPLQADAFSIVRIANGQETSLVNYYTPTYQGWTSVTNGSTPYSVEIVQDGGEQPVGGYYTYSFTKTFNLFTDFKIGAGQTLKSQIFMFKVIDGDPTMEEEKRSSTVTSLTLQGDIDAPSLTIDKVTVNHSSGEPTVYNFVDGEQPTLSPFAAGDTIQYSGTWSDNSTSHWTGGKAHINNIQLVSTGVNLTANMNDDGSWTSNAVTPPADSFTATLNASLTDWGGNTTDKKVSYYVSSSYPRLERITSLNADGSYKAGDVITIVLEYNKKVTFTGNGAKLTLNNGGEAVYDTSSNPLTNGTSKHYYKYTVLSSDNDTGDLNVSTINPNGCVWKDIDGTSVQNPSALPPINLEDSRNIKIDKASLSVSSITSIPSSGWYKAGKEIIFNVTFNKDVKFSAWNTSKLKLKFSTSREEEITPSASSSKSLQFKYTVKNGDDTNNLTALFDAGSCTINDYAGNPLTAQSDATALSGLHIDTVAPDAPEISDNITDNEYIYSEEGKTFTVTGEDKNVTGEEENATIYYSLDNVTDVNKRTWLDYPSGGVTLNTNGIYSVMAYQVDSAGNQSPKTTAKKVTVDTGNILTSITSSKPDGIYTSGDKIEITLNFRKDVIVSGAQIELSAKDASDKYIKLNPTATGTSSITYEYTVGSSDSCDGLLSVRDFTCSSITDNETIKQDIKNYVKVSDLASNNTLEANRSIEILTGKPEIDTITISDSELTIPFDRKISKGSGNITLKIADGSYIPPAVMSKNEWSKYSDYENDIQKNYDLGTNGSDDTGKADLSEQYILKYELNTSDALDTTNTTDTLITKVKTLKEKLIEAGADTVIIPIDSTAVKVDEEDESILRVDISDAYKLPVKGVPYDITIDEGLVLDKLGNPNDEKVETKTSPGVEKPVIRINKSKESISGTTVTQPLTAEFKIDCQTPGAAIKFKRLEKDFATVPFSADNQQITETAANFDTIAKTDITTDYATATSERTLGSNNTEKGYKYLIAAKAVKGANESDVSYEQACRSVVIFKDSVNASYDQWNNNRRSNSTILDQPYRWIRGGDWTMGGVSTPDFPFSWKSDEYDKVRAMTKKDNEKVWYWVSWQITTTAYVAFIAGDMPSDAATSGPQNWCWGSCAWVALKSQYPLYPGQSITLDTSGPEANRGGYNYQFKHEESRPQQ